MSLFSKKKEKSDTKDKKDKKSSTDKKAPKLSASSKHPSSNDLSLKKANLEQKGINLHVITANWTLSLPKLVNRKKCFRPRV